MNHTWYVCKEEHTSTCVFCEGGLALCTVCGGIEGSLTTECCGVKLPSKFLDTMIYQDAWDYHDGAWHKPRTCDICDKGPMTYYPDKGYICHSRKCRLLDSYYDKSNVAQD